MITYEEAETQTKAYKDVSNTENILIKFSETSNRMSNSLKRRDLLREKQMKHFTLELKKLLTLANFSFCQKSRKGFIMSLQDR